MAKASQSLQYVCRSCRQSTTRQLQARTFSNSASRTESIPTFSQTSSPELDALLLDWRRRVFVPAALNTTHQALVYKKSRRAIIENDPGVTVTMTDGEDVKLEPMVEFDKPNKKKSLNAIIKILGSTEESDAWAQLPAFLEGMQIARQDVPVQYLEQITRRANETGKAGIIKQCAAMVKKTGLSLTLRPVTSELFLGCHQRFIEARIKQSKKADHEPFQKDHHFAESLASMLESKDHCGGVLHAEKGQVDMRRDLTVLGVLLEFAATKAIQTNNLRDIEGTTANLCRKLIALSGDDILRRAEKTSPNQAIADWIPLTFGIQLALQVKGLAVGKGRNAEEELKNMLRNRLNELQKAIQQESVKLRAEANGKSRRALKMLDDLQRASYKVDEQGSIHRSG